MVNPRVEGYKNLFSTSCGSVIKKIRKEAGMSGADLAKELDISQQQMSRYERGINKLSIDMLFYISFVLNVSLVEVIKYTLAEMEKLNFNNPKVLKKMIEIYNVPIIASCSNNFILG